MRYNSTLFYSHVNAGIPPSVSTKCCSTWHLLPRCYCRWTQLLQRVFNKPSSGSLLSANRTVMYSCDKELERAILYCTITCGTFSNMHTYLRPFNKCLNPWTSGTKCLDVFTISYREFFFSHDKEGWWYHYFSDKSCASLYFSWSESAWNVLGNAYHFPPYFRVICVQKAP